MASSISKKLKAALLRPEIFYRAYLKLFWGAQAPTEKINFAISNGTLKSRSEWEEACAAARKFHLPAHREPTKNWDHLAAVSLILANTTPAATVLDAGAELYSNILPSLFLYGYRQLYGVNLGFGFSSRRGPIRYLPGDLTRTEFADSSVDAVSCLSVVEHGVPLEAYFREMFRILKPGGLLITSTDYFPTAIDTTGKNAHGAPIRIFSRPEIEDALKLAQNVGFELTGPVDLECNEKPVHWKEYDLHYTYILFTLRKPLPDR
jgi:SAM-dependent methyltransferase